MEKITLKEYIKDSNELTNFLSSLYGSAYIFHEDFAPEFIDLISKSGSEERLIKLLIRRLSAIIELGNIDCGTKWLEHLKQYGNMYSLHLDADSKNYRILFSKSDQGKFILHIFYEKEGKGNTSYAKHVPIAISRRDNTK